MATYTTVRLVAPQQLTTSASAALYTVGASTQTIVKQILLSNPTASSATATVYLVPNGSSAANTNAIIGGITIAANSSLTYDLSQVLNASDSIRALASAGTTITIMASGVEITA